MSKRVAIGSILQIHTTKGYSYAQLTHKNQLCGYLFRVLPGFFLAPIKSYESVVRTKELYYTFVFREGLNERPVTELVGVEKVPVECQSFPLFRAGTKDFRTGKVENWWLWDGEREWPIGELKGEQNNLPLREIWTSDILARRIEEGWMPSDEK
jgi:hypothetical protein